MILFRTLQKIIRTHKIEMKWSKDGIACTLNRMKIIGDTETATVNIVRLYRIFKVIIEVDELYLLSKVKTEKNKHDTKKIRRVYYTKNVSLGSRAGRPLVSFHLPLSSRMMASDEAVEEVQRLISENIDFDLTACTLRGSGVGCGLRYKQGG